MLVAPQYSSIQRREVTTYYVSTRERGTLHCSIQQAIDKAEPFSRIVVAGGQYFETVTVTQPVEIIGEEGDPPEICGRGVCLSITADVECYFEGVHILSKTSAARSNAVSVAVKGRQSSQSAVRIIQGKPTFSRCRMTSMYVGGSAYPFINNCTISGNATGHGLIVAEDADGEFSHNTITNHLPFCVLVKSRGSPLFKDNAIYQEPKVIQAMLAAMPLETRLGGAVLISLEGGDVDLDRAVAPRFINNRIGDEVNPPVTSLTSFKKLAPHIVSANPDGLPASQDQRSHGLAGLPTATTIGAAHSTQIKSRASSLHPTPSKHNLARTTSFHTPQSPAAPKVSFQSSLRSTRGEAGRYRGIFEHVEGLHGMLAERQVVRVDAGCTPHFEGNFITGGSIAVSFVGGGNGTFIGNTISHAGLFGVHMNPNTAPTLRNNIISQCATGILSYLSNGTLQQNTIKECVGTGLLLVVGPTTRAFYSGNSFVANDVGVAVQTLYAGATRRGLVNISEGLTLRVAREQENRNKPTDGSAPTDAATMAGPPPVAVRNKPSDVDKSATQPGGGDAPPAAKKPDAPLAPVEVLEALPGATLSRGMVCLNRSCGVLAMGGGLVLQADEMDIGTNGLAGMLISYGCEPRITQCRFERGDVGIIVDEASHPLIEGCTFSTQNEAGVLVRERGRGVIERSVFTAFVRHGIRVVDGGNPIARANSFSSVEGTAIAVMHGGIGRYLNNSIHGTARGVEVALYGDPIVQHNKIVHCSDIGVLVHDEGCGTIAHNTIESCCVGVLVKDGGEPTVRANTILLSTRFGICCLSGASGIFEKNRVAEAIHANVYLEGRGNVATLCANQIEASRGAGIRAQAKATALVKSNFIARNWQGGIVAEGGDDCQFVDNVLTGECGAGIRVAKGGSSTFIRNTVARSADCGLLLHEGSAATITQCTLRDNATDGIRVEAGSGGDVSHCTVTGNALSGINFVAKKVASSTAFASPNSAKDPAALASSPSLPRTSSQAFFADAEVRLAYLHDLVVTSNLGPGVQILNGCVGRLKHCTFTHHGVDALYALAAEPSNGSPSHRKSSHRNSVSQRQLATAEADSAALAAASPRRLQRIILSNAVGHRNSVTGAVDLGAPDRRPTTREALCAALLDGAAAGSSLEGCCFMENYVGVCFFRGGDAMVKDSEFRHQQQSDVLFDDEGSGTVSECFFGVSRGMLRPLGAGVLSPVAASSTSTPPSTIASPSPIPLRGGAALSASASTVKAAANNTTDDATDASPSPFSLPHSPVGVHCKSFAAGLVSGSFLRHCTRSGVLCDREASTAIKNCEVAFNTVGITCENHSYPDIVGNTVTSNLTANVHVAIFARPYVIKNTLSLCASHGIVISGRLGIYQHNIIQHNAGHGIVFGAVSTEHASLSESLPTPHRGALKNALRIVARRPKPPPLSRAAQQFKDQVTESIALEAAADNASVALSSPSGGTEPIGRRHRAADAIATTFLKHLQGKKAPTITSTGTTPGATALGGSAVVPGPVEPICIMATFEHNEVTDNAGCGVYYEDASFGELRHNTIHANKGGGVSIGPKSRARIIDGNHIHHNTGGGGVTFRDGADTVLQQTRITDNSPQNLFLGHGTAGSVSGNVFASGITDGVTVGGNCRVRFCGNTVERHESGCGVKLCAPSPLFEVSEGNVFRSNNIGLLAVADSSASAIVRGNTFMHNATAGVQLEATTNVLVQHNTFDAGSCCVKLKRGAKGEVTGNTFSRSGEALVVEGEPVLTVCHTNTFSENACGIVFRGHNRSYVLSGNIFGPHATAAVIVELGATSEIHRNVFRGGRCGIAVRDGARPHIHRNTFYRCAAGVEVTNAGVVAVQNAFTECDIGLVSSGPSVALCFSAATSAATTSASAAVVSPSPSSPQKDSPMSPLSATTAVGSTATAGLHKIPSIISQNLFLRCTKAGTCLRGSGEQSLSSGGGAEGTAVGSGGATMLLITRNVFDEHVATPTSCGVLLETGAGRGALISECDFHHNQVAIVSGEGCRGDITACVMHHNTIGCIFDGAGCRTTLRGSSLFGMAQCAISITNYAAPTIYNCVFREGAGLEAATTAHGTAAGAGAVLSLPALQPAAQGTIVVQRNGCGDIISNFFRCCSCPLVVDGAASVNFCHNNCAVGCIGVLAHKKPSRFVQLHHNAFFDMEVAIYVAAGGCIDSAHTCCITGCDIGVLCEGDGQCAAFARLGIARCARAGILVRGLGRYGFSQCHITECSGYGIAVNFCATAPTLNRCSSSFLNQLRGTDTMGPRASSIAPGGGNPPIRGGGPSQIITETSRREDAANNNPTFYIAPFEPAKRSPFAFVEKIFKVEQCHVAHCRIGVSCVDGALALASSNVFRCEVGVQVGPALAQPFFDVAVSLTRNVLFENTRVGCQVSLYGDVSRKLLATGNQFYSPGEAALLVPAGPSPDATIGTQLPQNETLNNCAFKQTLPLLPAPLKLTELITAARSEGSDAGMYQPNRGRDNTAALCCVVHCIHSLDLPRDILLVPEADDTEPPALPPRRTSTSSDTDGASPAKIAPPPSAVDATAESLVGRATLTALQHRKSVAARGRKSIIQLDVPLTAVGGGTQRRRSVTVPSPEWEDTAPGSLVELKAGCPILLRSFTRGDVPNGYTHEPIALFLPETPPAAIAGNGRTSPPQSREQSAEAQQAKSRSKLAPVIPRPPSKAPNSARKVRKGEAQRKANKTAR